MSREHGHPTFLHLGPVSAGVDAKGRVPVPASYVKCLRQFPSPEGSPADPEDGAAENEGVSPADAGGRPISLVLMFERQGAISLYPSVLFEQRCRELYARVEADPDDVDLAEYVDDLVANAYELRLDRQNRLNLPREALRMAGIAEGARLMFRGLLTRIEITEEDKAVQHSMAIRERYHESRRAIKARRER